MELFSQAGVNIAAPFIGMVVGAKIKNPKGAQATSNISESFRR